MSDRGCPDVQEQEAEPSSSHAGHPSPMPPVGAHPSAWELRGACTLPRCVQLLCTVMPTHPSELQLSSVKRCTPCEDSFEKAKGFCSASH